MVEVWESYFVSKIGIYLCNDPYNLTRGNNFRELMSPEREIFELKKINLNVLI